jgi:hemerythrin
MLIDKKALPLVAMDFMNEVHLEDVDIINQLFEQILHYEKNPTIENEENINTLYKKWYDHTVAHFQAEEVEMKAKSFPPYPVHKGEHEYALERMDQVFKQWKETKEINLLKTYFTEELVPWLANHIQTMDTVTAMFFKTGLSPCAMQH